MFLTGYRLPVTDFTFSVTGYRFLIWYLNYHSSVQFKKKVRMGGIDRHLPNSDTANKVLEQLTH